MDQQLRAKLFSLTEESLKETILFFSLERDFDSHKVALEILDHHKEGLIQLPVDVELAAEITAASTQQLHQILDNPKPFTLDKRNLATIELVYRGEGDFERKTDVNLDQGCGWILLLIIALFIISLLSIILGF